MPKRSRFRLTGDTHAEPDRSKRYKPCCNLIVLAQNLEARIRKAAGQRHEFLRSSHWQRLERHGVNQAEDGGVGANTERQHERRNQGESGILAQHSHAITQVLPKFFNPSDSKGVAAPFLCLPHPAECLESLASRLLWIHPRADILLSLSLNVVAQFFIQFALDQRPAQQRP